MLFRIYSSLKLFIYLNLVKYLYSNSGLIVHYRKKIFEKKIFDLIHINNPYPKFFTLKKFYTKFNLSKSIADYPKYKNSYQKKNVNTYQSEHNIHLNKSFSGFSKFLESYLNLNILPFYNTSSLEIKIDKMWFVISSQNAKINPHNHLDGHISGVYYPNIETNKENGLTIYNPFNEIVNIQIDCENEKINKNLSKKKIFSEKSSYGSMIIFDSYLMHSVNNIKFKDDSDYRVSLAWDAIFKPKHS